MSTEMYYNFLNVEAGQWEKNEKQKIVTALSTENANRLSAVKWMAY